jgi:hypothetical protein
MLREAPSANRATIVWAATVTALGSGERPASAASNSSGILADPSHGKARHLSRARRICGMVVR